MIIAKEEIEVNKMELRAKTSKIKGQPGVVRIHIDDWEDAGLEKDNAIELCNAGDERKGIFVQLVYDSYIRKGYACIREEDMELLKIRDGDPVILKTKKVKKEKREASEVVIQGNKLTCPVCRYDQFWSRKTLLNTRGLTFLDWDWTNKNAQNYVCSMCGYIYWFHP